MFELRSKILLIFNIKNRSKKKNASRLGKDENRARTRVLEIEKSENANFEDFSINNYRETRINSRNNKLDRLGLHSGPRGCNNCF